MAAAYAFNGLSIIQYPEAIMGFGLRDGVTNYRESVTLCQRCPTTLRCQNGQRYGTGSRQSPTLMIVAQNPPCNAALGLHGAYRLHYDTSTTDHAPLSSAEILIRDLISMLGLTPKQVWATSAYKCVTPGNASPNLRLASMCANAFLFKEIEEIKPRVILALGQTAQAVCSQYLYPNKERQEPLGGLVGYEHVSFDKTYRFFRIRVDARIVGVPYSPEGDIFMGPIGVVEANHPAHAVRFGDRGVWLNAVEKAVRIVLDSDK